jgi:hypothetical protein
MAGIRSSARVVRCVFHNVEVLTCVEGSWTRRLAHQDLPENQCVFVRGYRVVRAQDSTSGLQSMDLVRAVRVGGPSDPETISIDTSFPSTRSAHISNSKRHASGQQQNYLRKRRKQGHDFLDRDDDVSTVDNEETKSATIIRTTVESVNGPP